MKAPRYVIAGFGGEWECSAGHDGETCASTGIPSRCIILNCGAETKRVGAGSVEANRRLRKLRTADRARIEAAARARAAA